MSSDEARRAAEVAARQREPPIGDDHDPDPVNARGWHRCGSGRYVCGRPRPPRGREGDTTAQRDIVEKLDGKAAKCDGVLEVTLGTRPGGYAAPPRRPGVRLRPGGRVRARPSTTSRSRATRPARRSTSRPGACTGWRGTRAAKARTRLAGGHPAPRDTKAGDHSRAEAASNPGEPVTKPGHCFGSSQGLRARESARP